MCALLYGYFRHFHGLISTIHDFALGGTQEPNILRKTESYQTYTLKILRAPSHLFPNPSSENLARQKFQFLAQHPSHFTLDQELGAPRSKELGYPHTHFLHPHFFPITKMLGLAT